MELTGVVLWLLSSLIRGYALLFVMEADQVLAATACSHAPILRIGTADIGTGPYFSN